MIDLVTRCGNLNETYKPKAICRSEGTKNR